MIDGQDTAKSAAQRRIISGFDTAGLQKFEVVVESPVNEFIFLKIRFAG